MVVTFFRGACLLGIVLGANAVLEGSSTEPGKEAPQDVTSLETSGSASLDASSNAVEALETASDAEGPYYWPHPAQFQPVPFQRAAYRPYKGSEQWNKIDRRWQGTKNAIRARMEYRWNTRRRCSYNYYYYDYYGPFTYTWPAKAPEQGGERRRYYQDPKGRRRTFHSRHHQRHNEDDAEYEDEEEDDYYGSAIAADADYQEEDYESSFDVQDAKGLSADSEPFDDEEDGEGGDYYGSLLAKSQDETGGDDDAGSKWLADVSFVLAGMDYATVKNGGKLVFDLVWNVKSVVSKNLGVGFDDVAVDLSPSGDGVDVKATITGSRRGRNWELKETPSNFDELIVEGLRNVPGIDLASDGKGLKTVTKKAGNDNLQ